MNADSARPFVPAFVLALSAALLGQGIGVAFGANEDGMKASLKADADAVLATAYGGDAVKAKTVVDKSWVYYQRAHLHGGALGTFALSLSLLLTFIPGHLLVRRLSAIGVGAGALGYGSFWLLAGMRAPGLGGTGPAKDSLAWLAWPSTMLIVGGTVATLVVTGLSLRRAREVALTAPDAVQSANAP